MVAFMPDKIRDRDIFIWKGLSNLLQRIALFQHKCSMYARLNQPEIGSYVQRKLQANRTGNNDDAHRESTNVVSIVQ